MDSEGKKLLVRDMNEILRKDKSVSLFPTAAQKNRAQKQAKIEYKKKKLDAALAIVETEYASRALELQNDNLKVRPLGFWACNDGDKGVVWRNSSKRGHVIIRPAKAC